jgi:hypothetical protein
LEAGDRRRSCPCTPLFNYILKLLYLGCQWKELPIQKDESGREEIQYTGVYRAFRRWEADGCFDTIFKGTVLKLHREDLLDVSTIHGDGTTTAAKKGGDGIGFSGSSFIQSAILAGTSAARTPARHVSPELPWRLRPSSSTFSLAKKARRSLILSRDVCRR